MKFDTLAKLIDAKCTEDSYHDFQNGSHGQWMSDETRQYKLYIDGETGEVEGVQRVGTTRVFWK